MSLRQANELSDHIDPERLPPVERWNPPLKGDMNLLIARDGSWYHEGRPIGRVALVRLFATILRREADGDYYLVTPAEKWRIVVEDVPFLAVTMAVAGEGRGRRLEFRTNLGEPVVAAAGHPLAVEYRTDDAGPRPYLYVRHGLWARLTRALFLELAELAEPGEEAGAPVYGVWSCGRFFNLEPVG